MKALLLFASSRRAGNTGSLVDVIAGELKAEVIDLSTLRVSVYDYDHRNLIDQMLAHPILINRPIVRTPKGTRLCRPSGTVKELLRISKDVFVPNV